MNKRGDLDHVADGAQLFRVPCRPDSRGTLYPFDFSDLPFPPQRAFVVTPARAGTIRGGHASITARQLVVRLAGVIDIELFYRGRGTRVRLDDSEAALILEPLVWAENTYLIADAQLLVFANEPFDSSGYISDRSVLASFEVGAQ